MRQIVYRAFGYIITKTEFDVGDEMTERVGYCVANRFKVDKDTNFNLTKDTFNEKEYNHIWLVTRGRVDCEVEETGFKYSRGPGFCTLVDGSPFGTIKGNIVEGLDLFCIAPNLNLNKTPIVPKVTFFKLLQGEIVEMENTKLFLASGVISMNDDIINTTSQVRISGKKRVRALLDSYGFIFQ